MTYILQKTHEDIRSQRPFVRLVQDDGRVPLQHIIVHCLSQQHTIRHILEERCTLLRHVFESNRVSDLFTKLDLKESQLLTLIPSFSAFNHNVCVFVLF